MIRASIPILVVSIAFFTGSVSRTTAAAPDESLAVGYNRDIAPILSDHCYACHGPDSKSRKAKLRLDTRDGAFSGRDSGGAAVAPGQPEQSEVYRRIIASDPDDRMPPADYGHPLTDAQIETVRRWIEQGAEWEAHWSFIAPEKPALPRVTASDWIRNPIDCFILERLTAEDLRPNMEAAPEQIVRRATLDLTGLPPTIEEVDAFLSDTSPDAYERLVDRLLQSPRYGERMARDWLDASRYADTHGYHIDSHRDMWRWRDWVIAAFNGNQPFDEFTVDQIAGDLIPDATFSQKLATGFNRNHMINFEGGAIPEEYLNYYVIDRVNTTATVFLGLTVQCAQCHDHKYDPIPQRDFYRLYAYYNAVPENGLDGRNGNAAPMVSAPTDLQQERVANLKRRVAEVEALQTSRRGAVAGQLAAWAAAATAALAEPRPEPAGLVAHYRLDETGGDRLIDATGRHPAGHIRGAAARVPGRFDQALEFDGTNYGDLGDVLPLERTDSFSHGAWVFPTSADAGAVIARMDDADQFRGHDLYLSNGSVYVHLIRQWPEHGIRVNTRDKIPLNQWHHVFMTYDGSSKAHGVAIYVNGEAMELEITHDSLNGSIRTEKPLHLGRRNPGAFFKGLIDDVRFYDRTLAASDVAQVSGQDPIRAILATPADQRTGEQREALLDHYLRVEDEPYRESIALGSQLGSERTALEATFPSVMIMRQMDSPRPTFVLNRGDYDQKTEPVTAHPLSALHSMPEESAPNRLGLARWLVDRSNPLTARVIVNRFWQHYFGTGLVKTVDDFGSQGEKPSHPELLDWLATEFVESGWDVKHMQRLIVCSATYRQSSRFRPGVAVRDPENRLLARGPRLRLSAEAIRDQALLVGGLLVEQVGGPSVKPYQPPGLWREVAYGGNAESRFSAAVYQQDHGEDLYRRSLYTFWKRTCPPPSLQTFDAPEREFCTVRRSRTNTPLQALVLMNDPTYVEAARQFAQRIMTEGGTTTVDQVTFAMRAALARQPTPEETQVLLHIYQRQRNAFRETDRNDAEQLLAVGESDVDTTLDQADLAAWTALSSVLLNLDETITKP